MTKEKITEIVSKQRAFFATKKTLPLKFRTEALKSLRNAIKENEKAILKALEADLGKSECESFMCEVGLVLSEISYTLKNIKKFSRDKVVPTPLVQFAAKSYIKKSPYGVVLIMSPWNYPFLLTLGPLVNAISAGNTAVIKPSAYSPETSKIIKAILGNLFYEEYVCVIEGGREENAFLLEEKFDYIFFTGGKTVGKLVMKKASEHLTPVTLELGGKSPCVVDKSADISLSAKKIVFGKYLNCGQTCVAPDYILCHKSIKDKLITSIKSEIKKQFGENPLENSDYGKIINKKHFDRIVSLIDYEKTVIGGEYDESCLKISPTVMANVTMSDNVMKEEIFGPVLPVLTYESIEDLTDIINKNPTPLAFYVFASDKKLINKLTSEFSFGGGCINDVVVHLATSYMGFGGVGESGMGSYHGKDGFDTFSHKKSILDKKTFIDLPMRYQPYKSFYKKLIRMFLK